VPIAKRLGLGSVLGYLVAGVVIGPFVLGFVGHGGTMCALRRVWRGDDALLVGLELQPSLLWRLRVPILGLGGLGGGYDPSPSSVSSLGFPGKWLWRLA